MAKSTEFAMAGAGLLVAGFGLLLALFWSLFGGTSTLLMLLVYAPVAIALAAVGVYWLMKAQGLNVSGQQVDARQVPRA